MSDVQKAPAGWYPTPTGHQRWWDGEQWAQFATPPTVIAVRPLKDTGVAYLLAIFLGGFGAHHFYLGNTGAAVTQLLLNLIGWATAAFFVGFFLIGALVVWVIVDLFLIPSYVRNANAKISGQATA